ncbi:MAG: mandelate racemase/muconate lactonizing enzyme family protein [Chloroflexota bacterium]|nr:mandelate racemase/muconate lactonizing enzyme family protein [Chloroflexota bacterium]MDE2908396.1 mandelate racemase/muconate lactonizing enzyme family protein [Chloroflexota bacterium]
MTVERIETYVVEQALDTPFYFSQFEFQSRQICLVKVIAADGSYGWGEGYGPATVVQAGVEFLAPLVVGEDPLQVEAIWSKMHLRALDYARRGVLVAAISALDIALWDLRGKLLGQPVSTLLGGRRRERVKVYATGMYFTQTDDLSGKLAEEARLYVSQDFRALKMKVGLGVETDVKHVRAARAAIGPDVQLMVDANHAYSLSEALSFARQIEELDISFFEEPVSPEDYEGYRELRGRISIPVAGGECEYLLAGFRHLLSNRCVDIAQPDICGAGGLTETKRIAALAYAYQTNVLPHSWGTGIAFAAGLHLVSTLDIVPGRLRMPEAMLEMDRSESALRDNLTAPKFALEDGSVTVPNAPGLGVDVDTDFLAEYARAG